MHVLLCENFEYLYVLSHFQNKTKQWKDKPKTNANEVREIGHEERGQKLGLSERYLFMVLPLELCVHVLYN